MLVISSYKNFIVLYFSSRLKNFCLNVNSTIHQCRISIYRCLGSIVKLMSSSFVCPCAIVERSIKTNNTPITIKMIRIGTLIFSTSFDQIPTCVRNQSRNSLLRLSSIIKFFLSMSHVYSYIFIMELNKTLQLNYLNMKLTWN